MGNQIAWFNNQFYDNPGYDDDAGTKVAKYQAIAGITGPQKQLMGVSLSGDQGAETLDDMVQYVIPPLKAKFGSDFGGVMGWQFSYDQGGAWANGISQALAPAPPGPSSNLFIFYQGGNQYSGQLWYTTYDGTNWAENHNSEPWYVGLTLGSTLEGWYFGVPPGVPITTDSFGTRFPPMAKTGAIQKQIRKCRFQTYRCRARPGLSNTTAFFIPSSRGGTNTADSFGTPLTMAQTGPEHADSEPWYFGLTLGSTLEGWYFCLPPGRQ